MFIMCLQLYIIKHWFVGRRDFSVRSEATIVTGLAVIVVGFILENA
jgi:hypothetical protein